MSTRWKLATALGIAGAIAFSVPSAEARNGRNAAIGFGIAAGALALGAAAAASQPRYYHEGYYDGYYGGSYAYYGGPYAYQPRPYVVYRSRSYGYDPYNYSYGPLPWRSNRSTLDPGSYWNPNQ